jgi:hypothetical protein
MEINHNLITLLNIMKIQPIHPVKFLRHLILFNCIMLIFNSEAQEIISTSGNYFENGNYSVSSTLGEPIGDTFSGTENILTQGFQQSRPIFMTSDEAPSVEPFINVYPNPASDHLYIRLSDLKSGRLNYEFIDISGRSQLAGQLKDIDNEIAIAHLSSSIYLLKIYSEEEIIHKILIIKN